MRQKLSTIMISRNAASTIGMSLKSVQNLVDEIVVVDDYSTDKTREIAQNLGAKVFVRHEKDLGKQMRFAFDQSHSPWVLMLDSDEVVTPSLARELKKLLQKPKYDGYWVQFQAHLFGKPFQYGGENYKKMVFFNRKKVTIEPEAIHEVFVVTTNSVGETQGCIAHYSYRTLGQMYRKFTDYGLREGLDNFKKGTLTSLKEILLNPPHMFWARYIKDKGYKDGMSRIFLDAGFAYMELLIHLVIWFKQITKHE